MTKVIERRENEVTDFIIDGHAEKVNPDEGNILCAACRCWDRPCSSVCGGWMPMCGRKAGTDI